MLKSDARSMEKKVKVECISSSVPSVHDYVDN